MSEEKEKKSFGWFKNIIAAVVGAILSFLATFGIIGKTDADLAKEKMDSWMGKSETVYTQVVETQKVITEVKQLLADKKYLEAIAKLDTITDNAKETVAAIKEMKDEIQEAIKAIKEKAESVKEGAKDKVEEVKGAVNDVKEAAKAE